jgi:hypothetical protein
MVAITPVTIFIMIHTIIGIMNLVFMFRLDGIPDLSILIIIILITLITRILMYIVHRSFLFGIIARDMQRLNPIMFAGISPGGRRWLRVEVAEAWIDQNDPAGEVPLLPVMKLSRDRADRANLADAVLHW